MTNSPENTGDFERNRRSSAKRRSRAALDGRSGSLERALDVFGSTRAADENPWELRALLRSFKTALGSIAARTLGRGAVASTGSLDRRSPFFEPWLKIVTALTFVAWRMLRVLRTHQRWERRAVCYRLEEVARWRAANGPLTANRWARLGFDLQNILSDTMRLKSGPRRLEGRFWQLWVIFKAVFAGPPAPCRKPIPPGLARAEDPARAARLSRVVAELGGGSANDLSQPAVPPSVKSRRRAPGVPSPPRKPRTPRVKRAPPSLDELPRKHGDRWYHWPPTEWLARLKRRGQIHEPANIEEFEQLCLRALGPDPQPLRQAEVKNADHPALRAPLGNDPTGHSEEAGADEESRSTEASGVASERPGDVSAGDEEPRSEIPRGGKNAGPRNDSAGTAAPSPDGKAADRNARSALPRRPKSAPSAAAQSPDHQSPDHPMIQGHSEEPGGDEESRRGMASGVASEEPRSEIPRGGESAGPRNVSAGGGTVSPDASSEPSCVASAKPGNDGVGDADYFAPRSGRGRALRARFLNKEGSSTDPLYDTVGTAEPSPDEQAADRKTRSARPRRPNSAPSAAVQSPDHPSPDQPSPDHPITGSPDVSPEPRPLVIAFADALYHRLVCSEYRPGVLLDMLHAALEGGDQSSAPARGEAEAANQETPSAAVQSSDRPMIPPDRPLGDSQTRETTVCASQLAYADVQSPDHPSPDRPMSDSQTRETTLCASQLAYGDVQSPDHPSPDRPMGDSQTRETTVVASQLAYGTVQSPDHESPNHPMIPPDAASARERIEQALGAWMAEYHATLEHAAKHARFVQVLFYDLAASRCGVDLELLIVCRPPLTVNESRERRDCPEWDSEPVLPDGATYRDLEYKQLYTDELGGLPYMPFRSSQDADWWLNWTWLRSQACHPDEADDEAGYPLSAY